MTVHPPSSHLLSDGEIAPEPVESSRWGALIRSPVCGEH